MISSFLPQDKVAEFAHMDAVVVLKETMRAAGDPRLTQWHEALVTKGNKGKELESVGGCSADIANPFIGAREEHICPGCSEDKSRPIGACSGDVPGAERESIRGLLPRYSQNGADERSNSAKSWR